MDRPKGIKIIGTILFLLGIIGIIFWILTIATGLYKKLGLCSGYCIGLGILLFGSSPFLFGFILSGWGIYKLFNWGRILLFFIIGVIFAINIYLYANANYSFDYPPPIKIIIISTIIISLSIILIIYLTRPKVKEAFKQNQVTNEIKK